MDERGAYGFPGCQQANGSAQRQGLLSTGYSECNVYNQASGLGHGMANALAAHFQRPAPLTKLQRAQQIASEVCARRFPVTKLSIPNL